MYFKIEDKIVIFAIYKELAETAKKAIKTLGISIDVVEVSLTNFIEKAVEYKNLGKEIIITRGALADALKLEVDVNVVKINITGYDILNAIYKI